MVCCKDVLAQATSWTENTLHVWVWVNTCPNSYVLLENIPNWPVGPSSAEDVLAAFPLPGRDATETLPAVEAPVDTHGLRWPPEVKNNPDIIAVRAVGAKHLGWESLLCLCTCRSSRREPPRCISPRGMSGWRLCRKPWISVQMSRAKDWALCTSCGASAALVW